MLQRAEIVYMFKTKRVVGKFGSRSMKMVMR